MRVPYLGNAIKGWTKPIACLVVVKTVVDHEVVETPSEITLNINYQPMPSVQVSRKPEEQRTWKWWTFIIKNPTIQLKIDDVVTIGSLTFRVQSGLSDWTTSGFSTCEAIEDFTPPPVVPVPST
jgi:hypothetical protein